MNLIVSATRDTLTPLLNSAIAGLIFPLKDLSMRHAESFSLEAITKHVNTAHTHNKMAYISVNAIFHEDDLEGLKEMFKTLHTIPFDGLYFADLAVYQIAESYGLEEKLIYYPETYVTSDLDMAFWAEQSIKSAVLSREMTLEDIKTIHKNSPLEVSIIGHGYVNMFHSKRRLIKTFLEHTKEKDANDTFNKPYTIIEEIRDEKYPIYQDTFGTHVFRAKPLSSVRVFETIKKHVDHFIIDTQFYSKDRILAIVNDYVKLQNGQTIDESSYDDHDDGFYFKKTVYTQKKGMDT